MVRKEKTAAVAELAAHLKGASATVVTEYRGLTVTDLRDLREALGPDTTYTVAKNTLARLAVRDADSGALESLIGGPSAWAFVRGDVVEAAKALRDFARGHDALVIKGGLMDGAVLSPVDIRRLADLESREVLLTKLAGAMSGTLRQAVCLLAAPASQAARAMGALQAAKEGSSEEEV